MRDSVLKNVLVNLRAFFTINIRKSINQNAYQLSLLENSFKEINNTVYNNSFFLKVLDYYDHHEQEAREFKKELDYLRQQWAFCNFPYVSEIHSDTVVSGFDADARMPFVVHENKKLFFPSFFPVDDAVRSYLYYIHVEKLLGNGDTKGAPHQYQSPNVHVEPGDVVFDIGAAEGLFALDQVDRASRVIVVESDPNWIEPLRKTFAPYGEKVKIVEKMVSSVDTENTMSLKKLLMDFCSSSAFVKMDIEGYELPAITSAMDVLKEKSGIKIAAASYHRQHDADELKTLFDGIGYTSEFSDGYMLFHLYDTPVPPYFRRGIIRARS